MITYDLLDEYMMSLPVFVLLLYILQIYSLLLCIGSVNRSQKMTKCGKNIIATHA